VRSGRERWLRFWLDPVAPSALGCCRALACGAFLLLYWRFDATGWTEVSPVFWMPTSLFARVGLLALSPARLGALQILWKAALGLAAVGFRTRASTLMAFILGAGLLGLPHNFGKVHHKDAIVVLVLGILAVARCGDAWSVDRLIARARGGAAAAPLAASGEYRWPVRLVQVLVTLVFLGAGVSKLRQSGLEWIFSENLRFLLLERRRPLGLWVAQYGWLCQLLAGVTVAVELASPLALFGRAVRRLLIPTLFAMQVGIYLLMGTSFTEFMVAYLFWVPWDRIVDGLRVASRTMPGGNPVPTGRRRLS
jgi:hypothetical protein